MCFLLHVHTTQDRHIYKDVDKFVRVGGLDVQSRRNIKIGLSPIYLYP